MDTRTQSTQQEIDQTREEMIDKMELIEATVKESAEDVKTSAQQTINDTVGMAKDSTRQTTAKVKEQLDMERLINARPWAMLGVSVLVGYVLGNLIRKTPECR